METARGAARQAARGGVVAALIATLWCSRAAAFGLEGHAVIEAAAYKRLLAMPVVPGTGVPGVSGRTALATLIATHVLLAPPCFDLARPSGDCDEARRLDLPLRYWPILGAGAADLVVDRQLGQRGQCQHFMARTNDGTSPVDPRFGVPGGLVGDAYARCVMVLGIGYDGILSDPARAAHRLVGTYAMIHALEDSFSAAHVTRDARFQIVHLLSWTLIDWPYLVLHGRPRTGFPANTHHAVKDARDEEYLRWDASAPDGRPCKSFLHPYAVPEACLTPRALAAVDAVVDFLVMTYRLRTGPGGEARRASLFEGAEARDAWQGYLDEHLASVAARAEVPAARTLEVPSRQNLFAGLHLGLGSGAWNTGLWAAWLEFARPVLPFALVVSGGVTYGRSEGAGNFTAVGSLGLVLPLVRRFAIGASPLGAALRCDGHVGDCSPDLIAGVGVLLIPLGDWVWLGVEGPRWSWTDRAWGDSWFGLAFGLSHEHIPRPRAIGPASVAAWNPPRLDEVHAIRSSRTTRALYVAASIFSRSDVATFGVGIDWRRDRDASNRRSGLCPGLDLELYQGRIDAASHAGGVAGGPTLRLYIIPDTLSVAASPAYLRAGALGDGKIGFDVGARAGLTLQIVNVELGVGSDPFSYLSGDLRHAFPWIVRLGALLD